MFPPPGTIPVWSGQSPAIWDFCGNSHGSWHTVATVCPGYTCLPIAQATRYLQHPVSLMYQTSAGLELLNA